MHSTLVFVFRSCNKDPDFKSQNLSPILVPTKILKIKYNQSMCLPATLKGKLPLLSNLIQLQGISKSKLSTL